MASKINRTLIKKYHLDVGDFFFYENFLIAEVKEGIAFSFENAKEILRLAKMYYGNKTPFVYISNRKNSYSFNPTAHFKTVPLFPNLKGFAAVVYDSINQEIAVMEQSFFNNPVNIFYSLEAAIDWVEQLIEMD